MKSTRHPFRLALVSLLPGFLLAMPAMAGEPTINGIEAKLENGRVVTKRDVDILLFPEWKRLATRFPDGGPDFLKQLQESRNKVLQELIERKKIISQPNLVPIPIDSKAIDEEVQREIRENYEGKQDQFEVELRRRGMTLDGYRRMAQEKLLAEAIRAREAKGR